MRRPRQSPSLAAPAFQGPCRTHAARTPPTLGPAAWKRCSVALLTGSQPDRRLAPCPCGSCRPERQRCAPPWRPLEQARPRDGLPRRAPRARRARRSSRPVLRPRPRRLRPPAGIAGRRAHHRHRLLCPGGSSLGRGRLADLWRVARLACALGACFPGKQPPAPPCPSRRRRRRCCRDHPLRFFSAVPEAARFDMSNSRFLHLPAGV